MPEIYKTILDTHPDLICRFDPDKTFVFANRAAANFFRTEREILIGSSLSERVPPEQQADVIGRLDRLNEDVPTGTSIQEVRRENGSIVILWTNIAIYDSGELVAYQSVGRDITLQNRMRRQLKTRTQDLHNVQVELRAVLDAVPALIYYKDDKNNILRVNKAAADSLNMPVEDVEGRNTAELFGDAAEAYYQDDLEVFRSGKPLRGRIEPYTPQEGEQGWIQTDKIPIADGPDGPRILAVATDITEFKEQEALLKSINKNLDDFASLTSHDLQAPLRKIGISAELMQMELAENLPDGAQPYFDDIAKGVERMRTLIKSFLKFMRASPAGVELETIDLTALLERVADDESEFLEDAGGTIHLPDTPIFVRGDDALLGQVFANLIGNAIKYRHADRPVRIDITAGSDNQFWVVDVDDNGQGIDPNFSQDVFDLFGRAKPHTGIEGSGVGLALCRRIVTLHGGSIDLIPTEGAGSRFRVKLYRARRPADG
ncbi:PAS domain-containing protein [uncultured Algimonas sp.]|uniref:PAS domain-containing protein n=1 Tax=uncultured Algimonas sp. TaxID=1547920 RepID=UPI00262AF266|nr:PAS domain-containing protein [uncultured Algimonas sp.]